MTSMMPKHSFSSELPCTWVMTTLGEICTSPQYGYTTSAIQFGEGPKFLRITDLSGSGVDWESVPYCREQPQDIEKYRLRTGDLVIARSGSVGKAYRIVDPPEAVFASYLIRFRTILVHDRYVEYFLQSPTYWQQIAESSSGNTIFNVNAKKMTKLELALAPLNEQKRIVEAIEALFSRLDAGVAALKRVQANLQRYRASVLKAACEGALVPQDPSDEPASELLARILAERRAKWEDDQLARYEAQGKRPPKGWRDRYPEPQPPDTSDLPELPEGWVWASVEQLGDVQLGRQRSPQNRSKDYPTKYLRAANITEAGLNLSDVLDMEFKPHERDVYRLLRGDIILSEASGSPDQVGKPAVWNDELEDCCFQNTVIRLRPHLIDNYYLLTVFRNFYFNGVFSRFSSGVGINHLSANRFAKIAVPVAPQQEQQRIVTEVGRHLLVIQDIEVLAVRTLQRTDRLRQAILREAFAGRLVPQDPSDEPASALLARIRAERESAQAPARFGRKRYK